MIKKIPCALDEQETAINIGPAQLCSTVEVYSSMPSDLRRLWKLHEKNPNEVKIVSDDKYGTTFSVPRKWINIRKPRTLSDEQKRAAAERFARARGD